MLEQSRQEQNPGSLTPGMDSDRLNPGYTYGLAASDERDVHLSHYIKILYKRRWAALTSCLIVVVSSAVYTFTLIPTYEARAQILIEKENTNVVTFKEAFEQQQDTDDYYQTQYKILQSRALARRTLDTLKLWDHPEFNPKPNGSKTIGEILRTPMTIVSGWLKPLKPRQLALPDETAPQSSTIDRFLSGLTVSPVRNSRLVDIKFESTDPRLSANIANAISKAYIEQDLEFKFLSSKVASDWLAERLTEQRKQVDDSEQALQRYRERTDAVSLEERQNIVVQKLNDLNAAVTRAKTERIQKEALYNQLRNLQTDRGALDTFPAISANGFIQQQKTALAELQRQQAELSDKLGPRHPDMLKVGLAIQTAQTKLDGEIAKVVQAIRNEYLAAQAQERNLTVALEQQKGEALELNRKAIDYGSLTRAAVSNRQIFDGLLQRMKETGISGELKASHIRIVDVAEIPRGPIRPNSRNNMLLALLGGGMLGISLVVFFEYFDSRIKDPLELKEHLGLPFIGLVPKLFGDAVKNPLINGEVPSNFSESFRSVRTNVLFSSAEEGSRSVLVTSTGPGEGKSVVSANLAVALAQSGLRVVLVDADMRKPRVHSIFEKPQRPGLSDVLVGNAKMDESMQETLVPGLWIMAAGLHAPNPAELLGSKRFDALIASLVRDFDWVVVDTPPVMAVTDASVIAHLTSGVLFVVGAEMTHRRSAVQAIEQLEHAHAKFVGAVLNSADLRHHSYYYSQYYRREYNDYYQNTPTDKGQTVGLR